MSRFGTYLRSKKLARIQLQTAREKLQKKDDRAALVYTIDAMEDMLIAMNNLSSIQFEPRRKTRRKS